MEKLKGLIDLHNIIYNTYNKNKDNYYHKINIINLLLDYYEKGNEVIRDIKYNESFKEAIKEFEKISSNNINRNQIKAVSYNLRCEICFKKPIIGDRYKCSICEDYDLCEECNKNNKIHPHNFIKIANEENEIIKYYRNIDINKINEEKNDINYKLYLNNEVHKENKGNKKLYSYELLSKNCGLFIPNNSTQETISILLKNNGNVDWPKNETKLICDIEKSLIVFNDIILPPIKKGHYENIKITLNIPLALPFNTYKIYVNFNVKRENQGKAFKIIVYIVSELIAFRKYFDLNNDIFTDQEILNALKLKIKWEEAFSYLINMK